jgi:phage tail sheath protein FI
MSPSFLTPNVYVVEVSTGSRPIQAVGTSTAAFVGVAPDPGAHLGEAFAVNSWSHFVKEFVPDQGGQSTPLSHAVAGFFQNGGTRGFIVNIKSGDPIAGTDRPVRTGLKLLETVDEVAIVLAPGYCDPQSYEALLSHAENMRDRVAILDAPLNVPDTGLLTTAATAPVPAAPTDSGSGSSSKKSASTAATSPDASAAAPPPPAQPSGLRPRVSPGGYGAFYFPWIVVPDALDPKGVLVNVPPSGHMAGIWARSDSTRGVHKAPANEPVRGALNVTYRVTDGEQGDLNSNGVNCIRFFPQEGILCWGARTVAEASSEWRYLNVRRLFNMIEESIADSTRWIVFEPNDQGLWKSIRRDITAFLTLVWRDGALMGASPEQAFFVKCDAETNPPEVIDAGQVVTLIGIAPVKPAEFIVFRIGQQASGTKVETV